MNISRHCDLCENEVASFEKGLTCKLTKRKPDFENVCPNIDFGSKFQTKLEEANLELEIIRKEEKINYLVFGVLTIICLFLVLKSESIAKMTLNTIYFPVYKVGFIAIGITFFMRALYNLGRYREKLKVAYKKKNDIDKVIEKYGITYKVKLQYNKELHKAEEASVVIEYKND